MNPAIEEWLWNLVPFAYFVLIIATAITGAWAWVNRDWIQLRVSAWLRWPRNRHLKFTPPRRTRRFT